MAALNDALLAAVAGPGEVAAVTLGLSWSCARVDQHLGFAFSPRQVPRTLPWAGTLAGRPLSELAAWLCSWNPAEATVGLAVLNARLNRADGLMAEAQALRNEAPGHLRVFEHFRTRLLGQRVVVIGHYPGLESLWADLPYTCLERNPQPGDLPDSAAETLLPQADWVFITASSLLNHTLPRLLTLSARAQVVLMGPSLPWFDGWRALGVDYLAGVRVQDAQAAQQVVAEGGGTRLFAGPVEYALLELGR